jgi:2',3'-cyclic-nucleotide 2'-phosphodiesterase (5'-nucleotidase family)
LLFPSNLLITLRDSGQPQVLTGDGKPIKPDSQYTVAVGSFIARGGDGFLSFTKLEKRTDTYIRTADALQRYFEAKGTIYPDNTPRLRK